MPSKWWWINSWIQGFQNYVQMRNHIIQLWVHNLHNSEKKKKCIMTNNFKTFDKSIVKLFFFSYIERCMAIFSHKCSIFSQQIATALLQKVFTSMANQQDIPGTLCCCWDLCSSFYIARTMIGRNITNHSSEKKKAPCLDLFGGKTTFFPMFSLWKWITFVLKVKPKKICKLNEQKH